MLALAPVRTIRSSFFPIESLIREARYVLGAIKRAFHLPCLLEGVPELEMVSNSEVLATSLR